MEGARRTTERRSLKYIRLAAHFADQPSGITRIEMTIPDIEAIVGDALPGAARFPSWWRNDDRKMHSRAWMTAGWEVSETSSPESGIVFVRSKQAHPPR